MCGGLGPTQDDITRDAIARVMGVRLVQDDDVADRILERCSSRGRRMPANNLRQALVPEGATAIADPQPGTAPGLICPVGDKVIYAVPGVPYELHEIVAGAVLPDLARRAGTVAVIRSRTLRTWGDSESGLAEMLADHMAELDAGGPGAPTLAFLASGIEGLKVRITVKADDEDSAARLIDAEDKIVRDLVGDIVFGVDGETMEHAVGSALEARGLTLAVAESLTGGLIASRLVDVPGSSAWFRGGVVSYASDVKFSVLDVPEGPVVSPGGGRRHGHRRAGPAGRRRRPVRHRRGGPRADGGPAAGHRVAGRGGRRRRAGDRLVTLPGDRARVRQFSCITALDMLRRLLAAR